MLKTILLFTFGLFIFGQANAQTKKELAKGRTDTVIYYMKNSGALAPSPDSANYMLFILPKDLADKKGLYPVAEYYMSGKRKLIGATQSQMYRLAFEGTVMRFTPDGHRQQIMTYNNGVPEGDIIDYYPNGQVYTVTKYIIDKKNPYDRLISLVECHDSTGKVLAENGSGHWLKFNDGFKALYEEGPVSNGTEDGEWAIFLNDKKANFTFTKGVVTKPIDYSFMGKIFTVVDVNPEFKDGPMAFSRFLAQTARYPAEDREKGISGKVEVSFVVEPDGSLTNLEIIRSPSPSLSAAVVKALKQSPLWKPGLVAGIPVRSTFSTSVNFTMGPDLYIPIR